MFGEVFEKLDHAITYNDDVNANSGLKNLKRLLPSICFSVQKANKAVQVNSGLTQTTLERLEKSLHGPCGGYLYSIIDIIHSGCGYINDSPIKFSFDKNSL